MLSRLNENDLCPFQSYKYVLWLTEGRDCHSLNKSLLRVLNDLLSVKTKLYQVFLKNGERRVSSLDQANLSDSYLLNLFDHQDCQYFSSDEVLLECIQKGFAQRMENTSLYYLASSEGKIIQIEADLTEGMKQEIELILEIYQNQYTILDMLERDSLTRLLNRNALNRIFTGLFTNSKSEYCLAIFDIDHFKKINDKFGHVYGDEILLLVANLMRDNFRYDDELVRYGGEEFIVILPLSIDKAILAMERFRKLVENYHFPQIKNITISIGLVRIDIKRSLSDCVERADAALYYVKGHGRNGLASHEELILDSLISHGEISTDIELF